MKGKKWSLAVAVGVVLLGSFIGLQLKPGGLPDNTGLTLAADQPSYQPPRSLKELLEVLGEKEDDTLTEARERIGQGIERGEKLYSMFCDAVWSRDFAARFLSGSGMPPSLGALYGRLGDLYFQGSPEAGIALDHSQAYQWYCLAAIQGSFYDAIFAGDMARNGDGVRTGDRQAFLLYEMAWQMERNSLACVRLAICYVNGIGTEPDPLKAREYLWLAMLDGDPEGYYQYLSFHEPEGDRLLLRKAASSLDFSASYFDIVYGGLEAYSADLPKAQVVEALNQAWDEGVDEAAVRTEDGLRPGKYFPGAFVEACARASYTYSYHAFAQMYGLKPNRDAKDGALVQFAPQDDTLFSANQQAEVYINRDSGQYYELDFDGDGQEEIGVPIHSGAGGAFMTDGFCIFKKNGDGLWDEYGWGPDCSMRDAMRLIRFEGKIYFLTNPFSDTGYGLQWITARTVDEKGAAHDMVVDSAGHMLKQAASHWREMQRFQDAAGFERQIFHQTRDAVAATKEGKMFYPEGVLATPVSGDPEDNALGEAPESDVIFYGDIGNDGQKKPVRIHHTVVRGKYYDDYKLFQIFESREAMEADTAFLSDLFVGEYYGLHSVGNIYELFPIMGKVVQFWTCEWEGTTYCLALTQSDLVYTLQAFVMEQGEAKPVYYSILLDEAEEIAVTFE